MESLALTVSLVLAVGIFLWVIYNLIGEISAVSFVPTNLNEIESVLDRMKMEPGEVFIDLGSGDGRVVRTAVQKYGVKGVGYEIHPLLTWYAKIRSHGMPEIEYRMSSLWAANLSTADYVYCYLSPKAMNKLAGKFDKECKKGTIVISKAFEIKKMKKYLRETWTVNGRKYYKYINLKH